MDNNRLRYADKDISEYISIHRPRKEIHRRNNIFYKFEALRNFGVVMIQRIYSFLLKNSIQRIWPKYSGWTRDRTEHKQRFCVFPADWPKYSGWKRDRTHYDAPCGYFVQYVLHILQYVLQYYCSADTLQMESDAPHSFSSASRNRYCSIENTKSPVQFFEKVFLFTKLLMWKIEEIQNTKY